MDNISHYVNIMNIFVKHYNVTNDCNINMFHGVETLDDTNDMMEEFFEHITQSKECTPMERELFSCDEIKIHEFEQLFELKINDTPICACSVLLPLLEYIAKSIDWVKTDWKIVPLKIDKRT